MELLGFPERIMGVEVELYVGGQLGTRASNKLSIDFLGQAARQWHANGGCSYLDCHNLMEFDTPEVVSGAAVVAYDRALEHWLVGRAQAQIAAADEESTVQILRYNLGRPGEDTSLCGFHENYLTAAEHSAVEVAQQLAPFWVTRQIIGGAGSVVRAVGGGWRFELSQRSRFTQRLVSDSTLVSRGYIVLGEEALADRTRYRRLQVIGGDVNILAEPEAATLDFTNLMLLMFENQALPDIRLVHPTMELHATSGSGAKMRLVSANARHATPLAIQYQYAEAGQAFIDRHGLSQYQPAVAYWMELLDHLAADRLEAMVGRCDWATKRWQLEQAGGQALLPHTALALGQEYHNLLGGAEQVRAQYDAPALAPTIAAAALMPPPGRAALRAQIMAALRAAGVEPLVRWDQVSLPLGVGLPYDQRCFDMGDPYDLPLDAIAAFVALASRPKAA